MLAAAFADILSPALFAEPPADWSLGIIATTMHRKPDPATLGNWGYAVSLYLYGQYLVYRRTKDKKHLDYVKGWVDSHVDSMTSKKITSLDTMLPGNLLLILHNETGQQKYKDAADYIRRAFDTYPSISADMQRWRSPAMAWAVMATIGRWPPTRDSRSRMTAVAW